MPKQEGQKSKLLALLRIFEQQTDENHLLNVPQLVELLEAQGIRCERKSVYSDIEALGALGYDIKLRRGRGGGYFLASRTFDLAELKLLVDAVQASRVVSGTTSRRLIHKLEKLCSNYEGSQLQRQVYVDGRPKTDSKSLLYLSGGKLRIVPAAGGAASTSSGRVSAGGSSATASPPVDAARRRSCAGWAAGRASPPTSGAALSKAASA